MNKADQHGTVAGAFLKLKIGLRGFIPTVSKLFDVMSLFSHVIVIRQHPIAHVYSHQTCACLMRLYGVAMFQHLRQSLHPLLAPHSQVRIQILALITCNISTAVSAKRSEQR